VVNKYNTTNYTIILDILYSIQYNVVNGDPMTNESFENVLLELRRGVIVLAVLSRLDQEHYGYSLIKSLADHGLEIDQGTLYPLLRRLESQGLLQSAWRVETDRPRRYYMLSNEGRVLLPRLKEEWTGIVSTMNKLL
jgi:PadR family transcriptional regulator, regulatory protein PadR